MRGLTYLADGRAEEGITVVPNPRGEGWRLYIGGRWKNPHMRGGYEDRSNYLKVSADCKVVEGRLYSCNVSTASKHKANGTELLANRPWQLAIGCWFA